MLKSKINAVIAMKELNKISSIIGEMETRFVDKLTIDEKNNFLKKLFEIVAKIMFEFESPIIKEFPQLCPDDMLGQCVEDQKVYKIMAFDKKKMTELVLEEEVLYENVIKIKQSYQKKLGNSSIVWAENDG